MNTLKSYFFNAVPTADLVNHPSGYDREYDADDHAAFFAPFFSEGGVMPGGDADACRVRVQGGYTLSVGAGVVYIRGRMAAFDGSETVTVPGDCKIVVRMDKSMAVRGFQLLTVNEPTRTEDVYDLELASVTLAAVPGGHEVRVADTRTFLSYMGQPPYYPPDSEHLPYALWLYTMGFPMSAEQRAAVEGSPSLMAVYESTRPIDCGFFGDEIGALALHSAMPFVHQGMEVDGNGAAEADGSVTLEEHRDNPLAHQNIILDGNG